MSEPLEQRYRRLLRWYPAEHRATYEAEMLGVLLDCAAPGQRRPTWRERLDLVRGGLRCRLTRLGRSYDGSAWRDAAGVVGLVITAAFALVHLKTEVNLMITWVRFDDAFRLFPPQASDYLPTLAWVLALLALLVGPRWSRIVLGWTAFLLEFGVAGLVVFQLKHPRDASTAGLLLALVAAVCASVSRPGRRAWRPLGRTRTRLLSALAVVYLPLWLICYTPVVNSVINPELSLLLALTVWAPQGMLVPVAALIMLVGRPDPIRRRLWVLFAGLVVLIGSSTLTAYHDNGAVYQLPNPAFATRLDAPWYVAVTVLLPVLALLTVVAGARLVRWSERRDADNQELVAPG